MSVIESQAKNIDLQHGLDKFDEIQLNHLFEGLICN